MANHFDANAYTMMREAADRHDIPYAILKTIIFMESNGRWDPERTFIELPNTDRAALYPYVGMFEDDAVELGYDPDDIRMSQKTQIDAAAAKIAFIRLSSDWEGVLNIWYSGVKNRHMHTLNAMTTLKRMVGEKE